MQKKIFCAKIKILTLQVNVPTLDRVSELREHYPMTCKYMHIRMYYVCIGHDCHINLKKRGGVGYEANKGLSRVSNEIS